MSQDENTPIEIASLGAPDVPTEQLADLSLRPASDWRATLAKVIRSVVSIHYVHVGYFDTQSAKCTQATGFVVDNENGYILTNRHVVGSGQFWGYCTFSNHEECDVEVAYFDPVHDFAFLRYNPSVIRHANIEALELKPDAAQVGVEVRVVGNDSGEVLSIASAVLSRLDRNAPVYAGKYSDFNTSYIQASAVAKGGSSGSPVVDIDGFAIALQAGGKVTSAATNFFLPLQRVARALKLLQQGEKITRGTIQTQWKFESFDICRRLGLSLELEDAMRKVSPDTNTMLVAERILPEGPADHMIQKGDLLLKANGENILRFDALDDILDSRVGQSISLDIRRGDQDIKITVKVGDLHAITPNRMVKVADAVFNDMSYHIARHLSIPCHGVYSPKSGFLSGLPDDCLIEAINGVKTPDLDTFVDVVRGITDTKAVKISYRKVSDLHTKSTVFVSLLSSWYPKIESWTRDNDYKRWTLEELDLSAAIAPQKPKTGTFPAIDGLANTNAAYIANTIVKVSWTMRTSINGNNSQQIVGHGLIVGAEKGLVIVSRAIVLHDLGRATLNVANVEVSAQVCFLHPLHNYALLKYNPDKVDAPVQSLRFSDDAVELNEKVTLICVNSRTGNRTATETSISDVNSTSISGSLAKPQYRAINFEAVSVESRLATLNSFGVFVAPDGLVKAIWMIFQEASIAKQHPLPSGNKYTSHGLQTYMIKEVIDKVRNGNIGSPRVLDFEMRYYNLLIARKYGVAEKWLQQVAQANPRHLVYAVKQLSCRPKQESDSEGDRLEESDIILTLNDKLVTDLSAFGTLYDTTHVKATIVRDGQDRVVNVPTVSTEHLETTRALLFCGAVLQQPHIAIRQLMSRLPSEVFVSARFHGTPAELFKLQPGQFITHVNDTETPDLDAFMEVVDGIPDSTFFRLRTVNEKLIPGMTTIKKFEYYFPTKVYEREAARC